jgi:beta-lactamase family protein
MKVSLTHLKYLRHIGGGYFGTIPAAAHKPDPATWRDDQLTLSWLGHSTVLFNVFGVWILTDPALRARIGLSLGPLTFGPKRHVAPALRTRELPRLDVLLLTHAHMDHFDAGTLRRLPRDITVVTASATGDLLRQLGFRRVIVTFATVPNGCPQSHLGLINRGGNYEFRLVRHRDFFLVKPTGLSDEISRNLDGAARRRFEQYVRDAPAEKRVQMCASMIGGLVKTVAQHTNSVSQQWSVGYHDATNNLVRLSTVGSDPDALTWR